MTACIIGMNVVAFLLELGGGEEFVTRWSVIPVQVAGPSHWITILTAMFMHGSWSHILGNMVFLWAFGPQIEDAMNRSGWFARVTFVPAALLIGFWFLIELLSIGTVADVQSGGVAYMAHVGGIVFGAVAARLFEDPRRRAA